MKKVTVVIPCYNEEAGIRQVIEGFPKEQLRSHGYDLDILVVDNNSSDNTTTVAAAAGARVIQEKRQGKGNAIRTGFYNIADDADFVVMLDGDDTYKSAEIIRLLEPLNQGFSQVIIGSRLGGKIKYGSMRGFNLLGNKIFSTLVRHIYHIKVTDVLTGYFAWDRKAVEKLRPHLVSSGFAIEMEMITKMARMGLDIYSVPISYEPRAGESSLRPIYDGSRILKTMLAQLRWRPQYERFAFVSDSIYEFHKGGKERRLYEITRRLVKDGREVNVYTMKWWEGPNIHVQEGVTYHAISKYRPIYKNQRRSYAQALLFGAASLKLLFTPFDVADVDHMPFFSLYAMRIVCWVKRKPLYATWHEVWGKEYWHTYAGRAGTIAALIEKVSYKLPDTIISNSQHTTKQLIAAGSKKPIKTIPLGVDIDAIYNAPEHTLKSDVMYAGRLLPNKNVSVLILAIAELAVSKPDISCLIVGDGPERDQLEQLVIRHKLQSNVTFFNFFENPTELYSLMKASKVFVQPSTREGFGLVVIEANACGIPVVTTNHAQNAAKDLIYPGLNGLLASATPDDLAKQISAVLATPMHPLDIIKDKFGTFEWGHIAKNVELLLSTNSKE